MGFMTNLPEWLESRKLVWGILSFAGVIFLAIVGTIISVFSNVPLDLFQQAMYLVTGIGGGGTASQAYVDKARVSSDPTSATRTWRNTQPSTPVVQQEEASNGQRTPPSVFGR